MVVTITDPREIDMKTRSIRECRTPEEIGQWRIAIRLNGGERFAGEASLVAEAEGRILKGGAA